MDVLGIGSESVETKNKVVMKEELCGWNSHWKCQSEWQDDLEEEDVWNENGVGKE